MSFRELVEEVKKLNRHLDEMRSIFYGANLDRILPELIAALIDLSKEVKRLNNNVEYLIKKIEVLENVCTLLKEKPRRPRV